MWKIGRTDLKWERAFSTEVKHQEWVRAKWELRFHVAWPSARCPAWGCSSVHLKSWTSSSRARNPDLQEGTTMEIPDVQGLWDLPAMLVPGKDTGVWFAWSLVEEVKRTLWQVVRCLAAASPLSSSALPHVPPPLRALQGWQKRASQFDVLQNCD